MNRRVSDGNGNWSDEVTFVDVTVWGTNAENAQKYLIKGRGVFIEGRLQMDTWEDKASGQKRSKLKVVAEVLQFLPDGKGGAQGGGGGGNYQQRSSGDGESHRPSGGEEHSQPARSSGPPQGASAAEAGDFREEEDDIPF